MNIIIFEDSNIDHLQPFSINHCSFELKCGIYSNLERIINSVNKDSSIYLIVRPDFKELIQEKFPRHTVNPKVIPKGLYLNGAAIWNSQNIEKVLNGHAFSCSGHLVAFRENDMIDFENVQQLLETKSSVTSDIQINYISYLWDCIDLIETTLNFDKENLSRFNIDMDSSIIIDERNIYLSSSVKIEPGCILDASKGPIILNEHVIFQSGAIIKGPIFIDHHSTVNNAAQLKGHIIIGPKCKVGGEITDTIFHGYSNKQHDGFLGNSYIGEWVNLGANTNNSNLKNNYGKIKFQFNNKIIDTKKLFIGAMIGDFTRTGICTMINTGSNIGLGSNVFGGGFQKKYINSFSWGEEDIVDFNKFIKTVEIMKERRSEQSSEIEVAFLKKIYNRINK